MAGPDVPQVNADDGAKLVEEGAFLLDVREPDEWEAGHIKGALHIPLGDLPARFGELPGEGEVLVICRSGGRSARAVAWLNQNERFTAFVLSRCLTNSSQRWRRG